MSYTEIHTGRIKKIPFDSTYSNEEKIEAMKNMGYEFSYIEDDFSYAESENNDFMKIGDDYYSVIEHQQLEEGYCIVNKNDDGSLSYSTSFYNGGTCLEEMLEDSIKGLK
jgi:hypothetical protein